MTHIVLYYIRGWVTAASGIHKDDALDLAQGYARDYRRVRLGYQRKSQIFTTHIWLDGQEMEAGKDYHGPFHRAIQLSCHHASKGAMV